MTVPSDLADARDVGRRLGVAPETVLEWARQGRVPCVRLTSKVVRFVWPDVLAALRTTAPSEGGGRR